MRLRRSLVLLPVLISTVQFACSQQDLPSTELPADEWTLTEARTLIPKGSSWKYLEVGTGGTAWRATAFDDTSWKTGPAVLGYGDPDITTSIGTGVTGSARVITSYFRHAFTISQPSDFAALLINVLKDDGAVLYVNGTEVFRVNMPAGSIGATTRALDAVENAQESFYYSHTVPPSLLVAGTNVLAVEVHQASSLSSDLRFDLELQGSTVAQPPPPIQRTAVARGTFWKYLDAGADPGPNWNAVQYDDARWPSRRAPLGYGDTDISTVVSFGSNPLQTAITTYFRGTFTVDNPTDVTSLLVNMMVDDGAVVYLNGAELFRRNMPEGVVARNTLAVASLDDPEETDYLPFRQQAPANMLVPGTNWLAVEVHQADPASSDVRFDLELVVSVARR